MRHDWKIPSLVDQLAETNIPLFEGQVVFVVGANGSGKSALITQLYQTAGAPSVVKIAAHRQSWLNSSSVDVTPKARMELQSTINARDKQDEARWKDDYASHRTQIALFDLANAQNSVGRDVLELLKSDQFESAKIYAKRPSPLEALNDILSFSSLSVQLSINDVGDVLASHGGGPTFNIPLLSDGERNAVMIAAQVLTARPGTLFLIDEPERHLHRAITEPMLSALFEKRKDCCFVIATHEPELPSCNPDAKVVIVRSCSWTGARANGWDIDVLMPGVEVPSEIRRAILGARRRLLFIEGNAGGSLDFPLVSALYPEVSVVPRGSCREVERSVAGLEGTTGLHWLSPIGLIDRDDRTDDEVSALESKKVFALERSSIESVFYSSCSVNEMALVQAEVFGSDAKKMSEDAQRAALAVLDTDTKEDLAARRAERSARNRFLRKLPDWRQIKQTEGARIVVSEETTFKTELDKLTDAQNRNDLDFIVSRYAIKHTRIPKTIAEAMRFKSAWYFEEAVVNRTKRNMDFQLALRGLLGNLESHLSSLK